MKSILVLLAVLFATAVGADVQNCEPNANQAAFFIDAEYKGACVIRGAGTYATIDRLGLPNDSVSSIKIGANVVVRVCEHVNFGGRCANLNRNVPWMGNTIIGNDQLSSYDITLNSSGAAPAPAPRPVQPPPVSVPVSLEQVCYNAVQGKVAWDISGNQTWAEGNLRALCRGTTNPASTISCFRSRMPQLGWARAIQDCSVGQRPAPPQVNPNPIVNPPVVSPRAPFSPALSTSDMNKVMKWIAVRTSALRLPFCWRSTYTRSQRAADCPPEYTNVGVTCLRPDSTYSAPSRLANCPPGYTNMGLDCQKGANIFDRTSNMVCPAGYFKGLANRCYQNCRPGYTNNGEFCGRGASTLGMQNMKCRPGESRQGAFCYPTCKPGYTGTLNICSQNCPAQQPTNCALGCATTSGECRGAVFSMASSPFIAAFNIVSLGRASSVTAPAKAAKFAASATKMNKAVNSIKTAMKVAGDVSDVYKIASTVHDQVELFATEFSDNFEVLTSREIEAEIDRNFSPQAALQIKRQWGMRHLTLMLEADGFATVKNVLSIAGVFDPTGLVDVVNAYAHPICSPDSPFPRVSPRY